MKMRYGKNSLKLCENKCMKNSIKKVQNEYHKQSFKDLKNTSFKEDYKNELKFEKHGLRQAGITIIALVITIIILLILAGVTISMATSGSGVFGRAKNAADVYRASAKNENDALDSYSSEIEKADRNAEGTFNEEQKVNAPVLKKGMTPVKFATDEKDTGKMKTVETTEDDSEWYNYQNKQWANAQTEDGSLWVWIPRYAYKINKPASSDTEQKGTTNVVFLIGTTDNYIGTDGKVHSDTKRCKTEDEKIDTTTGWTVHPAFTNESSINYRNGGWDSELYGIWVAKFEAAFATTSNVPSNKVRVSSGINYSQSTVWGPNAIYKAEVDSSATTDGSIKARNYVDGIYGSTATSIKYPTFQGSSYSMNYINHNDAYLLSRKLTAEGNIYGLSSDADSHLIKNSEWGSVSYLSKSEYGLGSVDIAINNKNFNDHTNNVYAGTGYNNQGKKWNDTSIEKGYSASTTGNIYGIYDMSGGTWERVASYINNSIGAGNRNTYGASVVTGGAKSTKYATVYLSNETDSTNTDDKRGEANYNVNNKIYGDAVRETSTKGSEKLSWYSDYSYFPEGGSPFFIRGGYWDSVGAGLFYFSRDCGNNNYNVGFRPVLM